MNQWAAIVEVRWFTVVFAELKGRPSSSQRARYAEDSANAFGGRPLDSGVSRNGRLS